MRWLRCVRCFALFDYGLLLGAHWGHHRHPATANDPDFHPPGNNFWQGSVHFMQKYATAKQLAGMGVVYNVRIPAFVDNHLR